MGETLEALLRLQEVETKLAVIRRKRESKARRVEIHKRQAKHADEKLEEHKGNILRSAHELVKEWRTDKMLRPLQCLIVTVDSKHSLLISGSGEVIEPDDGVIGIGSGGNLAAAAARALLRNTDLDAASIVEQSLRIAAEICVYTNQQIRIEKLRQEA